MEHILLDKLLVADVVGKFPTLYGVWKIISCSQKPATVPKFWATLTQRTPCHSISLTSILTLLSLLCLGLFPSDEDAYWLQLFHNHRLMEVYDAHQPHQSWFTQTQHPWQQWTCLERRGCTSGGESHCICGDGGGPCRSSLTILTPPATHTFILATNS
jgi:hypothetical protein